MNVQMQLKKKAALIAENDAIFEKAKADGDRDLTAEEAAKIETNLAAAENIDKQIALFRKQETAVQVLDKPATARIEVGEDNAVKDEMAGFATGGEFLRAVFHAGLRDGGPVDERLVPLRAAPTGMSVSVPAEGGFLVPRQMSTTIFEGMRQDPQNLIPFTDPYSVEGESLTMNAENETSRATGSRWGGVRGYWLSEAAKITDSHPTFRQMTLSPKELAVMVYCTDKLLRKNAVALEQFITRRATQELLFLVNDAIINGTGAGVPLGLLNAGCLIQVTKETGQAADTVVAENISKMWARRLGRNFRWLINREVTTELDQLQVAVGASGQLVYMPPGGLSGLPYATLKGAPVIETEWNAKLGDLGDIILADLSAYATGTPVGGGIRSDSSMHIRFDYAETAFRIMFEFDGQPWLGAPLTPYKATSGKTLSPFVALQAR